MNTNEPTFHRAFGTYGIYYNEGKLLVIHKQGGPYTYRYDLPGAVSKILRHYQTHWTANFRRKRALWSVQND